MKLALGSFTLASAHAVAPATSHASTMAKGANTERGVRFGTISFRSYDLTVGESGPVYGYHSEQGALLSLDWSYCEHPPIDLETYWSMRFGAPKRKEELRLTEQERCKRLKKFGYTSASLKQHRKVSDIRSRIMKQREDKLQTIADRPQLKHLECVME